MMATAMAMAMVTATTTRYLCQLGTVSVAPRRQPKTLLRLLLVMFVMKDVKDGKTRELMCCRGWLSGCGWTLVAMRDLLGLDK
jgi:hypothetical protein